jgi:positive regulator of sigma E activity
MSGLEEVTTIVLLIAGLVYLAPLIFLLLTASMGVLLIISMAIVDTVEHAVKILFGKRKGKR